MPTDTEMKTWTLRGVEIFDVGTHRGKKYSDQDLDEIVANFSEIGLDVPIKLGHSEDQKLLKSEGLPAAGWITKLYRKGTKLAADIEDIPDEVYKLLKKKAYKNVSAEVWSAINYGGKRYENVLAAVAFLGAELPAVSTLGDILELYGVAAFRAEADTKLVAFVSSYQAEGARAVAAHTTKKADEAEDWDAGAEVKAAEVDDLKVMCAYVTGSGEDKGDYHLPHHRASDHAVIWKGVAAAAVALGGGRGASIPESVQTGVKRHLAKHYRQFDRTPPWEEADEEESVKAKNAKTDDDSVDDEAEELMATMEKLAERSSDATKGKVGAPAFRAFVREALAKLKGLLSSKKHALETFEDKKAAIDKALRDTFGGGLSGYSWPWIVETHDDHVIVEREGRHWQIPYSIGGDDAVELGEATEVEQTWRPKTGTTKNAAGESGEEEADMATTKAVLQALGLPETADDAAVVRKVEELKAEKAKHDATEQRLAALEETLRKRDAKDAVDAAIRDGKIAPTKSEWAEKFSLRDPAAFAEWAKDAPKVIDTSERGSAAGAPETDEVAQFQTKVAEKVKADGRDVDLGTKIADAQRLVAMEEPDLFAAIRARR